jgi:hypothetical protein
MKLRKEYIEMKKVYDELRPDYPIAWKRKLMDKLVGYEMDNNLLCKKCLFPITICKCLMRGNKHGI